MADTTTTNYGLTKPSVNDPAGDSAWGPKLNNNFDILDTNLKRVDSAASSGGGGAPNGIINGANGATVTAALADKGKMYVLAGSGVLSLPAVVQVAGWYAYIKKNDKVISSWSVSPVQTSGAPLIEGLNTLYVYQEEFVLFWDGTNFRTANRPKGWIDVGNYVLAAAQGAQVFNVGFSDPEIRDMRFTGENVSFAAADVLSARVSRGGASVASGYGVGTLYGTGTSAGYTTSTSAAQYPIVGYSTTAATTGFDLDVSNLKSGTGSFQTYMRSITFVAGGSAQTNISCGYVAAGSGDVSAVTLFGANAGSNFNAGATFSQRAFRP